jgi:hypothetical protein
MGVQLLKTFQSANSRLGVCKAYGGRDHYLSCLASSLACSLASSDQECRFDQRLAPNWKAPIEETARKNIEL